MDSPLDFLRNWLPLGRRDDNDDDADALRAWLEKRMEKVVQATVRDIAAAMKLYYETGQPTTAAALKAYKSAAR